MILRLLIVEDEKQICDAIAKSLYDAGYEVDTCYDGEEALECILAENYDLIVLAPQMASMFDELKHDCDEKGVPAATCSGKEYVGLTRDPAGALKFALAHIA